MNQLELHVDLLPDKHTEFMQSWQTFIDHIRNKKDLDGFELKQSDLHCEIILRWKNQEALNSFKKDRWCAFIIGAINVLGNNSSSKIE